MLANASRSLVVEDAQGDPYFATRPPTAALGIGAYSSVPLPRADGSVYGTLCALYPQRRPAQPGEVELLTLAGRLIVQAIDGAAMRVAERQRTRAGAVHAAALRRVARVSAIVAQQVDLRRTLDQIVSAAARSAGLRNLSILLLDEEGRTLVHAASIGLPDVYMATIDGLPIGPTAGSCGTAAYRAKTVITEDLETDPLWDAYRHLVRPHGWRAVWSMPLLGGGGRVLGTLAAYQMRSGRPTANQREVLDLYARLATVAVEAARAREREERLGRLATEKTAELAAIIEQVPAGIIALDQDGQVTLMNESGRRMTDPSHKDGQLVPERAASYCLRNADTEHELKPAETPLGRAMAGEAVRGADLLARGLEASADRYVRASAVPLYDVDGKHKGAVGVFSDVTHERTLLRDLAASEERLRHVYDAMACGVIVFDSAGALTDANASAQQILGLDLPALRADGITALRTWVMSVEEAPSTLVTPPGVLGVRQPVRDVVVDLIRPDGLQRRLHLDVVPTLDDAGKLVRVVLSFIDVTARARAEEALRASEERVRTVVSNAPVVLFSLDREGVYTLSEGRGLAALNEQPGQAVGSSALAMYRSRPEIVGAIRRALDGETCTSVAKVAGVVFETHYTPLRGVDGTVAGVIGVATDITARRRMEEEMWRQARHDALTDLPNRTLLHERLGTALEHEREDGGPPLALCLLDLDHFKEVNDALGHHAGDLLLRQVAARLREVARPEDTAARLGGDEFAVVLPGAGADEAKALAASISAALDAPYVIEGHSLHLRASIGIALGPEHGGDGATLLRRADVAMYAAKRSSGGQALYMKGQDAALPARLSLIADLRHAVTARTLELHYQPQIDLTSGRVVGVEALSRWPHPVHGFVPPDQFIPLAEGMGVVGALTDWALEEAIRQCRTWRDAGHALVVAVNLSAATVHDAQLPATVARLLHAHDVPPQSLRLEVTESALMADPARAGVVLTGLAELGVGISVDDYGTGYSSLAYLKRLPVDELKIDRSFVKNLSTEEADRTIVASTIGLGHSLGLTVVAEGVEESATVRTLAAMGCDRGQGYHWGKPLPAAKLDLWLRAHAQPQP